MKKVPNNIKGMLRALKTKYPRCSVTIQEMHWVHSYNNIYKKTYWSSVINDIGCIHHIDVNTWDELKKEVENLCE